MLCCRIRCFLVVHEGKFQFPWLFFNVIFIVSKLFERAGNCLIKMEEILRKERKECSYGVLEKKKVSVLMSNFP